MDNFLYKLLFAMILALSACSQGGESGPPDMKIQVVTELVREEELPREIAIAGTLHANESVELRSELEGRVTSIAFDEGQNVESGALLFAINAEELEALVAEAEANYNLAKANLQRSKALLAQRTISSQEYDAVAAAYHATKAALTRSQQRAAKAEMRAPFSGTMGARMVSPGEYVAVGQELGSLIDGDPIKAFFSPPERYASSVKPGMRVAIRVAAYPEHRYRGEVYFVSPAVDLETRTLQLKAQIPNPEGELRPGMFAQVALELEKHERVLTISESAVTLQGEESTIFIVGEGDKVEVRSVELGQRLKGRVVVEKGVAAAERVIIEGTQKVAPGVMVSYQ